MRFFDVPEHYFVYHKCLMELGQNMRKCVSPEYNIFVMKLQV